MATLVYTPGASNANSYCDSTYADAYFAARVGSDNWSSADKDVALIHATRVLDSTFVYTGYVDSESTQALRWPRTYVYDRDGREVSETIIPDPVKQATCELALHISVSGGYSAEVNDVKALRVGPIRIDSNVNSSSYSIPSVVQELLSGYGTFSGTVGGSSVRSVPVFRS
jgi:hypothetical protein